MTVPVATKADDGGVPRIGVTPEITSAAKFKISIPIENIGGPSAGLMLTLGIIDKVEPDDLTGGKIIAGTGTIDATGKVGPIGGLPQKLVAAKAAGATWLPDPEGQLRRGGGQPEAGPAVGPGGHPRRGPVRAGRHPGRQGAAAVPGVQTLSVD